MATPKIQSIPDCKTNGTTAQHSAKNKKPTVRDFRSLSDAAIIHRSPAKTWAAAWRLLRNYQSAQKFLWRDVAEMAKSIPEAGLDPRTAFMVQMDAAHMAGGAA